MDGSVDRTSNYREETIKVPLQLFKAVLMSHRKIQGKYGADGKAFVGAALSFTADYNDLVSKCSRDTFMATMQLKRNIKMTWFVQCRWPSCPKRKTSSIAISIRIICCTALD